MTAKQHPPKAYAFLLERKFKQKISVSPSVIKCREIR